jgi:hypothetical protein
MHARLGKMILTSQDDGVILMSNVEARVHIRGGINTDTLSNCSSECVTEVGQ